ncbi:MAG: TraR/DksA family transcriptional regulator [Xanthomonadaceae bacterium]|nr:TraR/DksA family transcriptional regulator [Xanthomonadaceae bacterium]
MKDLLLGRRAELEALAATRQASGAPVELDQARTGRLSRMDEMQGQEMARAGQARAEIELRKITAALQRLDDGSFGDCVACDEPIAPARLQADPAVVLCIKCAEAREV